MDSNCDGLIAETPLMPPINEWKSTDIKTLNELGKGISGIVQLAIHKDMKDQFFALKDIQMKFNDIERNAIEAELKINQSIKCQYVVKCYKHFKDDKKVSILLEYMDCGNMARLLEKKKRIPEQYLAAICKQLLEGLSYLHYKRHIIHRDLKPSNFLINRMGETKISDFGVSKILKRTYSKAETYTGTNFYMAPERIEGKEHYIRSDIWSLGLALLEFATGQYPYHLPENSADFEFLETIADGPPPRASSLQFSEEFCSFIAKWYASMFAHRRHPFFLEWIKLNEEQ